MRLDRFLFLRFRRRLRFVSSERASERTKDSLLDVVAVPSIPRGVVLAPPAGPQPGRLACWLHGRRMGMVVGGLGGRRETETDNAVVVELHITRKDMNLPITG